jgi:AraC family transcriptional regulator of arabinose operon
MEVSMQNIKYTDSASFRCLEHLRETSLDLYLVHCGREQCTPLHVCSELRDEYIIHFVLSGKGFYACQGKTWDMTAGQMFLISPGEAHTYISDETDPWKYAWIGFNGIRADSILRNLGFSSKKPVQNFYNADQVMTHINNILDARKLTFANDLRRKSELMMLLAALIDDHARYSPQKRSNSHDYATNVYLESAIDYIRDEYQHGIKVTDITNYVGISRTYLTQIFQKELGLSVQTFLIDYRLHKAANLLLSTSQSISQVSTHVGYEDALAFSKAFKKKFGISPKNYRTHHEKMDRFNEKQI